MKKLNIKKLNLKNIDKEPMSLRYKIIFTFIFFIFCSVLIYCIKNKFKNNIKLVKSNFLGNNIGKKINNKYIIKNIFYRDSNLYTQGLIYKDGILYESTGFNNSSLIKYKFDKNSNFFQIDKILKLDKNIFGEGLEMIEENDKKYFYQLTYLNRKIFKYDINFKLVKEFNLDKSIKQGWGLCKTNENSNILYLTNGKNKVYKIDIQNNKILDYKEIFHKKFPIYNLNECELINDQYFLFNVFTTNKIYKLNKKLEVIDVIDFSLLNIITNEYIKNYNENLTQNNDQKLLELNSESLFNGIAYNKEKNVIYLTGKNWPLVFEIKLVN